VLLNIQRAELNNHVTKQQASHAAQQHQGIHLIARKTVSNVSIRMATFNPICKPREKNNKLQLNPCCNYANGLPQ